MDWVKERTDGDKSRQKALLEKGKLPKHVAIIMDGNGRWALERGLSRTEGHKQGIESVRDIVKASSQIGVKFLTLYAFSIENWKRPATEVGILMRLLESYLRSEIEELDENDVRLKAVGKLSALPKRVQKSLFNAIERTKNNEGLTLTLALSYGGRWDIVRAAQMIALDARRGKVSPEDITDELFSEYLSTRDLPDPDLLIRTSGEVRLSNFLLWEAAYSEIYIAEKYWPDFRREDFYQAIENYLNRERRFGKIAAQIKRESDKDESYIKRVINAFKSK